LRSTGPTLPPPHRDDRLASALPRLRRWLQSLGTLLLLGAALFCLPTAAAAAPGLCVGPVCGDNFTRSAQYHWQLRLRVSDQMGHRERLVVDCRSGALSPAQGLVDRGYAAAVARRACRLAGDMAEAGTPLPLPQSRG